MRVLQIIPAYLVAAQEREAARSATAQLAVLRLENDRLQKQVNDFKEERKRARKVPNGGALRQNSGDSQRSVGGASFGRRTSSQDQSQSQSQSQMYSQTQGQRQSPDDVVFSPPKKVVPGGELFLSLEPLSQVDVSGHRDTPRCTQAWRRRLRRQLVPPRSQPRRGALGRRPANRLRLAHLDADSPLTSLPLSLDLLLSLCNT